MKACDPRMTPASRQDKTMSATAPIDRDGRHAFVTNTYGNTASVLDLKYWQVIATVPVGKGHHGISMTP